MNKSLKVPNLREYAMIYLGRYNNTEAGLTKVLQARIKRWSVQMLQQNIEENTVNDIVSKAYQDIPDIVNDMKKIGAVNDHAFVESKVKNLIRSGHSQKMIQYKLQQKGIGCDMTQSQLKQYDEQDIELLAALIYIRKRRIGPFRYKNQSEGDELYHKERNSLARGGFSFYISDYVLKMDRSEAENEIDRLRALSKE